MGRPKGSKNIKSFNAEERAKELDCDPLEILMKFSNGDWKGLGYDAEVFHLETPNGEIKLGYVITPVMRVDAAKTVMKYLYSTKQPVDPISGSAVIKVEVVDYVSKKCS